MAVFQNNLLAGASAQSSGGATYTIDQSIRFPRTSNTAGGYMSRTFGSAGDRTSWTWSCWFKLGSLNSFTPASNLYYQFFACDNATNDANRGSFHIIADSGVASAIAFQFQAHSTSFIRTNRQFRDPSAWYHITLVWDSDNSMASERVRLYINGQRETNFAASSNPSSGQEIGINLNATHRLGISYNIAGGSVNYPFDGYMAEIHFLDGYSYGPEYFGETNSSGIWIPKEYSGSYGTNGFKIDGRDSADLGDDESGNGNDFTTSGLGAHDQVLDTPTNNFPTLNPISSDGLVEGELTGGNLEMRNIEYIDATMPFPTSGKWYWELCTVSKTQGNWNYGNHYFRDVEDQFPDSNFTDFITTNFYHGSNFYSSSNWTDGDFWTNSNEPSAGDVFGFAWDADNKKIWLAKNNTYFGSGDPAGNSGTPLGSGGTAGVEYLITMYSVLSQVMTLNFGQDDTFNNSKTSGSAGAADGNGVGKFYYAPPSGFLALCSKNVGS